MALTDVLGDGLSMVYSFFEPDIFGQSHFLTANRYPLRRKMLRAMRSLDTFMILDHIARARAMGLPYVYLGYWVRGSRKMD